MDYVAKFEGLISEMKLDGRYRTFIELERIAGQFPTALWHGPDGQRRRVTVWCSNDYLGKLKDERAIKVVPMANPARLFLDDELN